MADCEELFSILGTIFPNRVRVLLSAGRIDGMAGRYAFETLERMGHAIEANCPAHSHFPAAGADGLGIAGAQRLVSIPPNPDIVVRYLHFHHDEEKPCRLLAVASGPSDAIDELGDNSCHPMPLSPREMKLAIELAAGQSLQDIAQASDHSIHTVRNQVKSAMRATGTRSQTQLVALILEWLQ